MARVQPLLLCSLMLLSGCTWPVRERTERLMGQLAVPTFDLAPPQAGDDKPKLDKSSGPAKTSDASNSSFSAETPETDVQTVALMQEDRTAGKATKYELKVPAGIPGSEASLPDFSKMTPEQKARAIKELYPDLEPLPEEPVPQPGPEGRPYTLADLQKLAVENSPTLRQAVADVANSEGALVQAKTYPNPTIAYQASPTNNNSNAGAQGGYIDQPLRMWGKMNLSVAAAQKDLDNAKLALMRARSDLSTNVRNAYFTLIVAQETMRVNRALARFTDEIYSLYTGYLAGGFLAPYEPAPLRAQAYTTRLAYQQAINSYTYAWIQLVAVLGLKQLPLTAVEGRVDRFIPYYDFDKVRAYILEHHTDVLTARNGVKRAQYNMKLAQITPYPDIDLLGAVWKESTIPPYTIFYQAQVVMPLPLWDQNKGNIISAQAALLRAVQETQRVENALTNTLAANYTNYQNNLIALENYRRWILPDQVRYYRGVFQRRQIDIGNVNALNASPSDLVTAQQALAANVQTYLGILGSLWSSVVSVADLMQTPDLFQLADKREKLPELPDLNQLPLSCPKPTPPSEPLLPSPRRIDAVPERRPQVKERPAEQTSQLAEPPPEIPERK